MATGGCDRGDVDLAQVHSSDGSSRQRRRKDLAGVQRQAEFVVVRPPGQLGPT